MRLYEHSEKEGEADSQQHREALFDACLLAFLTTVPPDRVGVSRQLQLGATLHATGNGGYDLDLSAPGLHKTSAAFGPVITAVPAPAAKLLTAWLKLAGRTATSKNYVFVPSDDASARCRHQWRKGRSGAR